MHRVLLPRRRMIEAAIAGAAVFGAPGLLRAAEAGVVRRSGARVRRCVAAALLRLGRGLELVRS